MLLPAFWTMLAESASIPRTLHHLVLRANVQELTVVLGALAIRKEMTQRHAGHVVLMQVLALVTFLALAAQPMLADIRALHALMPHRAFVACLA